MCSCHSILECCVTFSGVKLSIRSFVLSLIARLRNHNATDDDNEDFRSFKKNLHSKLGKLM